MEYSGVTKFRFTSLVLFQQKLKERLKRGKNADYWMDHLVINENIGHDKTGREATDGKGLKRDPFLISVCFCLILWASEDFYDILKMICIVILKEIRNNADDR